MQRMHFDMLDPGKTLISSDPAALFHEKWSENS